MKKLNNEKEKPVKDNKVIKRIKKHEDEIENAETKETKDVLACTLLVQMSLRKFLNISKGLKLHSTLCKSSKISMEKRNPQISNTGPKKCIQLRLKTYLNVETS